MTLGERIRTCRQQAGMSQEKVAELVGISRQSVTKWETNRSAPSTENLFKLAEIFGTTVDLLLPEKAADEESNTIEPIKSIKLSRIALAVILVAILAILLFVIWQAGQDVGEDIGEFIYNLNH